MQVDVRVFALKNNDIPKVLSKLQRELYWTKLNVCGSLNIDISLQY